MRDATAQERVGEQPHTVQLDQQRGMAEENDTVRELGSVREPTARRAPTARWSMGEKLAMRCLKRPMGAAPGSG